MSISRLYRFKGRHKTLFETRNQLARTSLLGRILDQFHVRGVVQVPETNVLGEGNRKEIVVLGERCGGRVQICHLVTLDGHAVDEDLSGCYVVHASEQFYERRFSTPVGADDNDELARLDRHADIFEGTFLCFCSGILKRDVPVKAPLFDIYVIFCRAHRNSNAIPLWSSEGVYSVAPSTRRGFSTVYKPLIVCSVFKMEDSRLINV